MNLNNRHFLRFCKIGIYSGDLCLRICKKCCNFAANFR